MPPIIIVFMQGAHIYLISCLIMAKTMEGKPITSVAVVRWSFFFNYRSIFIYPCFFYEGEHEYEAINPIIYLYY